MLGEGRLPKYHPRMEAIGSLDEATAALGLARSLVQNADLQPILLQVQRDLYGLMAEVAATPENAEQFRSINKARVEWLEIQTDTLSKNIEVPKEFILPGETQGSGAIALARTVVRRAERRVAELFDASEVGNPELVPYLNRLSSLCFLLELAENRSSHKQTRIAKE